MAITIKLSTTLRNYIKGYEPQHGLEVEFKENMTASSLASQLSLPLDEIHVVMLNGIQASIESKLADGDRVAYFPAVGGG